MVALCIARLALLRSTDVELTSINVYTGVRAFTDA